MNYITVILNYLIDIWESNIYHYKIDILLLSLIFLCLFAMLMIYFRNRMCQKKLNSKLIDQSKEIGLKTNYLEKANLELREYTEELKQQKEEIHTQAESLEVALKNLRELNEFKEGLIGMIVHDLKNPLNIILNISANELVIESGRQMLNMVNNILDVQKYESSKMPLEPKNNKLNSIVTKSLQKVNYLLFQKEIQIKNFTNSEFTVFSDADLTERIYINLLTNAIKYTPNRGEIQINAQPINEKLIKISITDNGPGIPESLRDRIFDKFTQIIAKKSGFTRSTGLGLTFCKLAVEAHDGKIGVDSEIGEGTTFWFTLPTNQLLKLTDTETGTTLQKNQYFLKETNPLLVPYIQRLKKLKVYEVSKIQNITTEIKSLKITEIESVIQALENAAYSVNQEEYDKILSLGLIKSVRQ